MPKKPGRCLQLVLCCLLIFCSGWTAAVRATSQREPRQPLRLVMIKVDGLPPPVVERWISQTNPRTGRSVLPWIEKLFFSNGIRVENFYTTGASVSSPSWFVLDTGQPPMIHGNIEFDRNTGQVNDFLNILSFHYQAARSQAVYPPTVETLDALGIPLLSDAFAFERRETGIQLFRRGSSFLEFLKIGLGPIQTPNTPVTERIGDLMFGVDYPRAFKLTTQATFLNALKNPEIRYADFYNPSFDKHIHDDIDPQSILGQLQELDTMLGQTYAALVESGSLDRTILVVVSDHGTTFDSQGRYSQGINLVNYLRRSEFGGHHVLTKFGTLSAYSLAGSILSPKVPPAAVSKSKESPYLGEKPAQVTCAVDHDGNQQALIHFRHPDLNRLQILRSQAQRQPPSSPLWPQLEKQTREILTRARPDWAIQAGQINQELAALRQVAQHTRLELEQIKPQVKAIKKRKGNSPTFASEADRFHSRSRLHTLNPDLDVLQRHKELTVVKFQIEGLIKDYQMVAGALDLLAGATSLAELVKLPEARLFPPRMLGDHLEYQDLVNYPIGFQLTGKNDADLTPGFQTINYLEALCGVQVKNSVRSDIGTHPVEFATCRMPAGQVAAALVRAGHLPSEKARTLSQAWLLYGGADQQLLEVALNSEAPGGGAAYALFPVRKINCSSSNRSQIEIEFGDWKAGLPLKLFEDPALMMQPEARATWLSAFHSGREWLTAVHLTEEGLGVLNLPQVLNDTYRQRLDAQIQATTDPLQKKWLEFQLRRREAVDPDLFLHSNKHWNFDSRDFNAGSNHGGFFRESMQSTLWLFGGEATPLRQGPVVVQSPYQGLDLVPTLFSALGYSHAGEIRSEFQKAGYGPFPGQVMKEIFR